MPKPKPENSTPPITIPFFSTGLYTRRNPLFAPFKSLGVNIVSYHDALIAGQDMEVNDLLEIQRRPGYSRFCSVQLYANEIVNQFYSSRTLTGNVLSFFDSNLNWSQFTSSSITPLLIKTTTRQGFPATVGNMTYYANGKDFVKLDQNGNVTPWGIAAPTTNLNVTGMGFWQPGGTYSSASCLLDTNGNIQYTLAGGGSGNVQPTWATALLAPTNDGSIIWSNRGPIQQWAPLSFYAYPSVIIDTNGNIQQVQSSTVPAAFNAGTAYVLGNVVSFAGSYWTATTSTTGNVPGAGVGTIYWVPTVNPVLTGSSVPSWNSTFGGTTSDGAFTWINCGQGFALAQAGYQYVYALRTIYGELSTASVASNSTGPILGPQPANVTAFSITSNFVTLTCANNFTIGNIVQCQGFSTATYLNGVALTVTGATTSQFTANFIHANASGSDSAICTAELAMVSGTGVVNPLCNAAIISTSVQVTANIATITAANTLVPGLFVSLPPTGSIGAMTAATFLNSQQYQVISATATQFQIFINHANYGPTADTGAFTFDAIEIYRTADGGGIWYGCGAVANPGLASWTFNDFVPDANLSTQLIAPIAHANDPPPGAAGSLYSGPGIVHAVIWWQGRLWIAIDNYVYFSAGPDCINGDPYGTFPPNYRFGFPGPVTGLAPTDNGMVVGLGDRFALILGGPQTATFYPWDFLKKNGLSSPNCMEMDGQTIYILTTQGQFLRMDAGKLANDGAYVGDVIQSTFPPASSYVTVHREGLDDGVYIGDGSTNIIRQGMNLPCWSPLQKPVNGIGALRSIETSVGVYTLMAARATPGGYLLARNVNNWQDDGQNYSACTVTIGSIQLSTGGAQLIEVRHIVGYFDAVGSANGTPSQPTVSILPNEITDTGTDFIVLPESVVEPPIGAAPSTTLQQLRWPTFSMASDSTSTLMHHLQVKISFQPENAPNTIKQIVIKSDQE